MEGWLRQEFTKDDMTHLVVAYGDKYITLYANAKDGNGNEQIRVKLSSGNYMTVTHDTVGKRKKDWLYRVVAEDATFSYASYQMIFNCFQRVVEMLERRGITFSDANVAITSGPPEEQIEGQLPLTWVQ